MKRREQIAVTAVLVAALALPLLLMLAGVRPNVDENRELTAAPTFDAGSVTNDATWSQFADYLTDRFPMRDHAIELDAEMRTKLSFSEAARDGVPRGRDGWLYHADTLNDDCLGPPPKAFFTKGDKIPARAEKAGTPFLFVVIPDKVVVYPEHQADDGLTGLLGLEKDGELPGCVETWVDALAEEAPSREWLWNLGPELAETADESEELLYFQIDTHWTNTGAMSYVEGIVERLAPGTFDPAEVVPAADTRGGDLAKLKGTPRQEFQPGLEVRRPGVTVVESNVSDDERTNVQVVTSKVTSTDAPLIEGITVILGDSFTRQALPLLVPYFEELVFLQRPYLLEHTVGEALEGRVADRIIIGEVQRNVAKGWYVEFMEAANRHLVHEQD